MDEQRMERELNEVLAMLKAVEHKMVESGTFSEIKDIFVIHLDVIHGGYDMSDALEFIKSMYAQGDDME